MKKSLPITITLFSTLTIFLSRVQAQQPTPAPTTQKPPAASAAPSPSSTQSPSTAAKKTTPATGQAAKKAPAPLTLKTQKDKISYAIGMNEGKRLKQGLKQSDLDVDRAIVLRAFKDALSDAKLLMADQEMQATLTTLQADIRKRQELLQQQAAENNKKDGDAFLASNKAKDGVVTTPDGLQYKILEEGTGPKPNVGDVVTVNYRGTLINGTEFDSSYKRGQPTNFTVGQVVKGWNEALQLMPVGSKWQLFIPSDLAYGARGAGRDIAPNSMLIFEVELLSIQPKLLPAAPTPGVTPAAAPPAAPTTTPTTSAPAKP